MGDGADAPDGLTPRGDAPDGDAGPDLVRPYVARHYQDDSGAHQDDTSAQQDDSGAQQDDSGAEQVAPEPPAGLGPGPDAPASTRSHKSSGFEQTGRHYRPAATVESQATTELPVVIEVALTAAAEPTDSRPDRGRTVAVAGAAVVVLLAIVGVAWAVGDRGDRTDVVLVGPTGTPTATRPRTAVPSTTPGAGTPTPTVTPTRTTRPTATPSTTTTQPGPPTPTSAPTTTAAPTTPPPTTPPPPGAAVTGTVYVTGLQPRRCLDVRAAQTQPGTAVQGYDCNGTGAQVVTFTTAGTVQVLGRCVQPQNGALSAGTPIVINDCAGSAAQQWRVGGGAIRHLASDLCLGLPNASTANSVQLRLEACAGTAGQRWTTPL